MDREKTQIQTTKNPRTEKHKCKKKNTIDEAQGREGAEGGREGESDPHDTRPVQDIYCRYIHIGVIMKMQSRPQRLLLRDGMWRDDTDTHRSEGIAAL